MSSDARATAPTGSIGFAPLIAVLCLAELVVSLETNMVTLAIGQLYKQYGDPVRVGWVFTAFTLSAGVGAAICARLGDIFGRRKVLLLSLAGAGCGSLLSAMSPDLNLIIAGRVLQGLSMAILPLCFGLLRELADPERVGTGVGILGGVYSFGIALGFLLAGSIIDHGYWQWIFVVSTGSAFLALLGIGIVIPRQAKPKASGPLDVFGGALFGPAIGTVLFGFDIVRSYGWASVVPWAFILGGIATLWVWWRHELRQEKPLIDVRLLADRRMTAANFCMFFIAMGPMLYTLIVLPIFLQPTWTGIGFGLSATVAGLIKLPSNVVSGIAAMFSGALGSRFGFARVALAACLAVIAGWTVMIFSHDSLWVIFALIVFGTIPLNLLISSLPAIILKVAPEERASEATGLLQVAKALGMAIGTQAIATILASSLVTDPRGDAVFPSATAYSLAFLFLVATASLAALAIWNSTRSQRS